MCNEHIGYCEWCGLFDHHLIMGECERCRAKVQNVEIDYSLGDEADVSHVVLEVSL
ncbi:MAG: hypothetical protein OEW08_11395 [Gammaproteobacteria bacterium]|nr:hypothetical protein [Gammaproteobacteria bacterium]